jgi:V8-like Glu-specific endopeptidase
VGCLGVVSSGVLLGAAVANATPDGSSASRSAVSARPANDAPAAGADAQPAGVRLATSAAAQQAVRAYWTPARMRAASAAPVPRTPRDALPDAAQTGTASPDATAPDAAPVQPGATQPDIDLKGDLTGPATGAPPGTPTGTPVYGLPSVGALFYVAKGADHYCTASVVVSSTRETLLTAAHCVYASGYRRAGSIEFVPKYHNGLTPYGVWVVTSMLVPTAWRTSHDINSDYAFLQVVPPPRVTRPIQLVTGANTLGVNAGYVHPITVLGYPAGLSEPLWCVTESYEFEPNQLGFNCHGYTGGTSGSPWLINYDRRTYTGTVIGVIGGYQGGGRYEYTSYSPYFGTSAAQLLAAATASRR